MRFGPENVVVSCEHASHRVPAALRNLGLATRHREAHIAWDRGAAILARILARRLGAPCHLGRWSRLVVDLNRSLEHPKLVAAESFGVHIPGNAGLEAGEIDRRIRLYWQPYRRAANADVHRVLARAGRCLHVSVHSFTPVAHGVVRRADVGLLYDPRHAGESSLVRRLQSRLAATGLHVRRNYPYTGNSDGFTTALRRQLPHRRYAALEIEANQNLLATPAAARRLARILADAVAEVLEA